MYGTGLENTFMTGDSVSPPMDTTLIYYLSSQAYPKAAYLVHSALCSTLVTFLLTECTHVSSSLQPIQSIPADMLHLQEDLDLLSSWSHDWKLRFNVIKCLLLQIHNRLNNSTAEAQSTVTSITTPHYVQHYTINGTPIATQRPWGCHDLQSSVG